MQVTLNSRTSNKTNLTNSNKADQNKLISNKTNPASFSKTQQILQAAQQKLLFTDTPLMLRAASFLRLSCLASEKPGAYSKLLKALSEQHQEWWNTCEVTPAGLLKSSDLRIHQLLAPVLYLHQNQDGQLAA